MHLLSHKIYFSESSLTLAKISHYQTVVKAFIFFNIDTLKTNWEIDFRFIIILMNLPFLCSKINNVVIKSFLSVFFKNFYFMYMYEHSFIYFMNNIFFMFFRAGVKVLLVFIVQLVVDVMEL